MIFEIKPCSWTFLYYKDLALHYGVIPSYNSTLRSESSTEWYLVAWSDYGLVTSLWNYMLTNHGLWYFDVVCYYWKFWKRVRIQWAQCSNTTILPGQEQIYWNISSAVLGAFVSETPLHCAEPSSYTVQQFHTTDSSIIKIDSIFLSLLKFILLHVRKLQKSAEWSLRLRSSSLTISLYTRTTLHRLFWCVTLVNKKWPDQLGNK